MSLAWSADADSAGYPGDKSADDLTPAEWKSASDRAFGKGAPVTAFTGRPRFEAFPWELPG